MMNSSPTYVCYVYIRKESHHTVKEIANFHVIDEDAFAPFESRRSFFLTGR